MPLSKIAVFALAGLALAAACEIRCNNGKCTIPGWVCDGYDICGDGSDEVGCEVLSLKSAMASQQHPDWDLPAVPLPGEKPKIAELTGEKVKLLRELAAWFLEEELPETPDADLVKFLHSCDYDVEKAKLCAKDFHYGRREVPEMFTGWDVSLPNIQSIFQIMRLCILPRKTPENHRIVMTSLITSDTTDYVIADVGKVTLMCIESIFMTEPTLDGLIIIHDIELATFSHFLKAAWNMPRKLRPYFQAGLPIKRHSMHLLHCSGFVDGALKLVKSFGRKEDWDRLRVHRGDNLSALHETIPKDCLPCDLGGSLPSVKELHGMTVKRLAAFKKVFESKTS